MENDCKQKLNYDADLCPCCKKGRMITLLHFDAHGPPDVESVKALLKIDQRENGMKFFNRN